MEPSTGAFRPLSASDLVDETFRIYRKKFGLFAGIGAVLMIPVGVITVLQQIAVQQRDADLSFNLISSGTVDLLRVVVYLAVVSAMIYAVSEIRLGRTPTVSEAYSHGMERFPAMIWVGFLYTIVSIIVAVTIIGLPFATYLWVGWLFALHVTVLEGQGGWAALTRSRSLVRGSWWRVLGITILVASIVGIVNLIFALPSFAFTGAIAIGDPSSSFRATGAAISAVAGTAGTIITGPVAYIASVLLYYDLRARKEGLDLEMMASQTEAAARSASYQS